MHAVARRTYANEEREREGEWNRFTITCSGQSSMARTLLLLLHLPNCSHFHHNICCSIQLIFSYFHVSRNVFVLFSIHLIASKFIACLFIKFFRNSLHHTRCSYRRWDKNNNEKKTIKVYQTFRANSTSGEFESNEICRHEPVGWQIGHKLHTHSHGTLAFNHY